LKSGTIWNILVDVSVLSGTAIRMQAVSGFFITKKVRIAQKKEGFTDK
jgi:hypothetical protein